MTLASNMWDRLKAPQQLRQYAAQKKADAIAGRMDVDADDDFDDFAEAARLSHGVSSLTTGYSYSIRGGPPPPKTKAKPARDFLAPRYPPYHESSTVQIPPPPRNPNRFVLRGPNPRPTSSIYSLSTETVNLASRQTHGYGVSVEISPPSSPEPDDYTAGYRGYGQREPAPDVSPIEEDVNDMATQLGVDPAHGRPGVSSGSRDGPPSNQNSASIPAMRRERRKKSDAALHDALARGRQDIHSQQQQQHNDDTRWDPMTGEQTTDVRGRPSQVKPAEYAHGLATTAPSKLVTPQKKSSVPISFGDRVRRMAQISPGDKAGQAAARRDTDPAAGAFTSSRPGWRGASGRTTLVDPVRDSMNVPALKIPTRSGKRNTLTASLLGPNAREPVGIRGQTPPVSPPSAEESNNTRTGSRDAARKSVRLSQIGTPTPTPTSASTLVGKRSANDLNALPSQSPIASASPSSSSPGGQSLNKLIIKRKAAPSLAGHQPQESVSSIYSQQTPESSIRQQPSFDNLAVPGAYDGWVQPPSRFSVSTYTTSTTGTTGTPQEFGDEFDHDRPPIPIVPSIYQESLTEAQAKVDSVMDRKRPIPERNFSSDSSPVVKISLNDNPYISFSQSVRADRRAAGLPAPPTRTTAEIEKEAAADERPMSVSSNINKSLPPVPPEMTAEQARDRVGVLNAQLQALANRRINLNRSIKQMTELMPTDNLMASEAVLAKREAEKRKVATLREELSEVQRGEYELGLKLHRAYKRMDRDADCEPTTLWVRRVTG